MGNPKAFMTIARKEAGYRPILERIADYGEVEQTLNIEDRKLQASRCMDCGVAFCNWACPLGNKNPEWQDLVYKGRWKQAYEVLHSTNNFPEFTGRICPAPCEKGCVLNIDHTPVTIRENEASVAEYAFNQGYIKACPPASRNGKKVAVIGAGPAGLALADQLNQQGYLVTVFEKDEEVGGLLRYGIPDFKLSKAVIERRVDLLKAEGIVFKTRVEFGTGTPQRKSYATTHLNAESLFPEYDYVCVTTGTPQARDLQVEGRELKGIYLALELLQHQNRFVAGEVIEDADRIKTKNQKVLVIGGGDTGSDCVGTSNRHGATAVTQIEIMPEPPEIDNPDTPWPNYPNIMKTTSSHQEGCTRRWNLSTRRFIGENGRVKAVEVERVEWTKDSQGKMQMRPTGEIEVIEADFVFLAMGFLRPQEDDVLLSLGFSPESIRDQQKRNRILLAGDAALGASLVVRAINSGREVAEKLK